MKRRVICVSKDGEEVSRYTVGESLVLFGRSFDADIVLLDELVSRRQASIHYVNGSLILEDLESRNGTLLNGKNVSTAVLSEGDLVTMGSYEIRIESAVTDGPQDSETGNAVMESVGDAAPHSSDAHPSNSTELLYRMAQLLRRRFNLEETLPKILALIMEAAGVKRGLIMTYNEETREPEVRVSLMAPSSDQVAPVSVTLMDYVRATKNAVFTPNAKDDPRFNKSESVHHHGIGAAMLLPLYGTDDVTGMIQLDANSLPDVFTTDQLQLLSALGRMVCMAIEDAQLSAAHDRQQQLVAIGNAIAEIGHDMNNIVLGLKCGMEIMKSAQSREEWNRIGTGMHIVEGSVERFEHVIGDLMAFVRRTDLQLEPLSLKSLIDDVIQVVGPHAETCGVAIAFSGSETRPTKADSHQLHRVLVNLLHNAIDSYEDRGGVVEIHMSQNPAGSTVQIRDSGAGIACEDLARIFQPFFTTKRGRGTGLGLPFSQRVIRQHGGRISVDSEPGRGSTFSVFIPGETVRIAVSAKTRFAEPAEPPTGRPAPA